jgi:hypothetical protein
MPTWLWVIIVNGVLLALIGYIWRGLEGRVKDMECSEKDYVKNLIEHPILTVTSHEAVCDKRTHDMQSFVETQTSQLVKQISDVESRTGLLIENAVLKASRNGRAKRRGK